VVLKSEAVIDPWTVMVHYEHALIAYGAVMCAYGLNIVAVGALFMPRLLKLSNSLISVL
jgi:capsular polysaccharide biosynthesis protein